RSASRTSSPTIARRMARAYNFTDSPRGAPRRASAAAAQLARPPSRHAHLVAKLVRVARPARIMRGERPPDLLDPADERLPWRPRAEPLDHPVAHAVPVAVTDAPVDSHVAHDGELPIVDGEVEEHAVPLGRLVHAELREERPRPREGVHGLAKEAARQPALQMHPDLGRCPRLGGLDRVADRVEVRLAEEPPRPPGALCHGPSSPRLRPPERLRPAAVAHPARTRPTRFARRLRRPRPRARRRGAGL